MEDKHSDLDLSYSSEAINSMTHPIIQLVDVFSFIGALTAFIVLAGELVTFEMPRVLVWFVILYGAGMLIVSGYYLRFVYTYLEVPLREGIVCVWSNDRLRLLLLGVFTIGLVSEIMRNGLFTANGYFLAYFTIIYIATMCRKLAQFSLVTANIRSKDLSASDLDSLSDEEITTILEN